MSNSIPTDHRHILPAGWTITRTEKTAFRPEVQFVVHDRHLDPAEQEITRVRVEIDHHGCWSISAGGFGRLDTNETCARAVALLLATDECDERNGRNGREVIA